MSGIKSWERRVKRGLLPVAPAVLPRRRGGAPDAGGVNKALVFRLDQRIGNGLLALPLLRAIRASRPGAEIHFFIHHPIASLLEATTSGLVDRFWPYDQAATMRPPWRYLTLFERLRKERFDAAFTLSNPDGFSFSQAVMGRCIRPRCLVGFDPPPASAYFDVAVPSSTRRHYTESMVDLWRAFVPAARVELGGLRVPEPLRERVRAETGARGGVLFWLGATGGKGLPVLLVERVREHLASRGIAMRFLAGPADRATLDRYPEPIRARAEIWTRPLLDTAALFRCFDAIVAPDTGPLHLAVALDLPTLGLFTTTSLDQYGYADGARRFTVRWADTAEAAENLELALAGLRAALPR